MAPLPIVKIGDADDASRSPAAHVATSAPTSAGLLDDMVETLRDAPGVGLAAPQIGLALRVAVIEYPEDDEEEGSPMRLYDYQALKIVGGAGQ